MNRSLNDLLSDADPMRLEAPYLDTERERIRLAMLRTRPARRQARFARSRLGAVATFVIVAIGAAALGYQLWIQGTTPVLAAVRFEMRLAEDGPIPGLVVAKVSGSERLIYLHPEIVVNNDDVADASVLQDGTAGFGVAVWLLPPGAERMRQATTSHRDRPVAILIDGAVVSAPVVRAPIGDSAVISGIHTRAEAERLASGIGGR